MTDGKRSTSKAKKKTTKKAPARKAKVASRTGKAGAAPLRELDAPLSANTLDLEATALHDPDGPADDREEARPSVALGKRGAALDDEDEADDETTPAKFNPNAPEMLINYTPGEECRIAIVEDGKLEELHVERAASASRVGNIYVGKVMNVEAAIQAAFVDFGLGENGFLHVTDLHPRYFPGEDSSTTERVGIKTPRRARPPIQRALRKGDEIIVQVLKEGVGTKGPTLTGYLSIPGRFLVMMPYMDKVGVSRKVEDEDERRKMSAILNQLALPDGFGFILRTAGMAATKGELKRDLSYLQRLWKDMDRRLKAGGKPRLLYSESDLLVRALRDLLSTDVSRIVVDHEAALQRAARFLKIVAPRTATKLVHYQGKTPIYHAFAIEPQIANIHAREVPLPSGGRLVIDQTEALVAIDVNSGRSRDSRDSETNAYQTNIEAVDEICRQLRLRDMGGIVVNDLIDMRYERHRKDIEQRFLDRMKRDRAKSTVLPISEFGIVEMTRQRMRPSHESVHFADCPICRGRGMLQKPDSVASDAMRDLAFILEMEKVAKVELVVAARIAGDLLSSKRRQLNRVEHASGKHVDVRIAEQAAVDRVTFYAYDASGSDVDLTNIPRPKPPKNLIEWIDPDPRSEPAQDAESVWSADAQDEVKAAERADAEALAHEETHSQSHPIEFDTVNAEPDGDWGTPLTGAGSRGGRSRGRGGRGSEQDRPRATGDRGAPLRPAPAQASRPPMRSEPARSAPRADSRTSQPLSDTRSAGRGMAPPARMVRSGPSTMDTRRDSRSDRPARDDRGPRDGPRDGPRSSSRGGRQDNRGPSNAQPRGPRPSADDTDEWGEPVVKPAPRDDYVPQEDRPQAAPPRADRPPPRRDDRPAPRDRGASSDRGPARDDRGPHDRGAPRGRGGDRPRPIADDTDEWGEPIAPRTAPAMPRAPLTQRDAQDDAHTNTPRATPKPRSDADQFEADAGPMSTTPTGEEPREGGHKRRRRRRGRGGRGGDAPLGAEQGTDQGSEQDQGDHNDAPLARDAMPPRDNAQPARPALRTAPRPPSRTNAASPADLDEWGEPNTPPLAARPPRPSPPRDAATDRAAPAPRNATASRSPNGRDLEGPNAGGSHGSQGFDNENDAGPNDGPNDGNDPNAPGGGRRKRRRRRGRGGQRPDDSFQQQDAGGSQSAGPTPAARNPEPAQRPSRSNDRPAPRGPARDDDAWGDAPQRPVQPMPSMPPRSAGPNDRAFVDRPAPRSDDRPRSPEVSERRPAPRAEPRGQPHSQPRPEVREVKPAAPSIPAGASAATPKPAPRTLYGMGRRRLTPGEPPKPPGKSA